MAARMAPRKTLMQLWKQGWNEIPEVMGSSAFALVGIVGLGFMLHKLTTTDCLNHRYKHKYIVYRPEDPRVERIRKFPDSPPTTKGPGVC